MCMSSVATGVGGAVLGAALDVASGGTLTAPIIAALATSAAGTIVTGMAQQEAVNKQNDIAAAGIIKQGQLQQQGENDVSQVTKQISSQTPAQQTAAQLASYQKALTEQNANLQSDQPNVPGASKAYTQEKAVSGGDAANYVNALAKSGAVTEGTQLERVQEGQEIAGTASNLGLLQTQSNEQAYLTKLQIQATQANPWLTAIGNVMKGAGAAMGTAAGWNAAGSVTDSTVQNAEAAAGGLPQTSVMPFTYDAAGNVTGGGGAFTTGLASGGNTAGGTMNVSNPW